MLKSEIITKYEFSKLKIPRWNTILLTAAMLLSPTSADEQIWTTGTAHVLAKGRWEVGVFQPLRYGLLENLEISTHPLVDFLSPNVAFQKAWLVQNKSCLASRHGFCYPTPLLNVVSKEGTGGVLPADTKVPHIFCFTNQVIRTQALSEKLQWTARAGVVLVGRSGEMDMATIDLPIVYPRTSAYYNGTSFLVGLDVERKFGDKLAVLCDLDVFMLNDRLGGFAWEHKGLLKWFKSKGFMGLIGYKLVYGAYPFGKQMHLLPLVDVQWGFGG